jgi:hypothetical protein
MISKINGQFTFIYEGPKKTFLKKENIKIKFIGPLIGVLMGIFLLPQPAHLAEINSDNIFELINTERQKENLEPLTANHLLTKAAYQKGEEIINSNIFQHTINNKKFSEWIKETGYKYSYVGENLAIDFVTAEGTIQAWLESETHRMNILNPVYKETGIAIINDKFNNAETTLIVQIFGTPPNMIKENPHSNLQDSSALVATTGSKPEHLLNHSVSRMNVNTLTALNPRNIISLSEINFNEENKFFEQFNFSNLKNNLTIYFFIYFFYLSLLFLIIHLHYLSFVYLNKIL